MSLETTVGQKALYDEMWEVDDYKKVAPGEGYVDVFCEMAKTTMRGSLLDAGCGSGKGALALKAKGFDVRMCDLTAGGLVDEAKRLPFTEACLWEPLKRKIGFVDWVYCCDVFEHLPTQFVGLATMRLLEVARRGVFLSIALFHDGFGAWVGQNLHQTVWSFEQWRDLFNELGEVQECRDLINNAIYLVTPKRSRP